MKIGLNLVTLPSSRGDQGYPGNPTHHPLTHFHHCSRLIQIFWVMFCNLNDMQWIYYDNVYKKLNPFHPSSSLISHSARIHKIYQVHPWIIGSFQYVLTAETLIKLIAEREEYKIGNEFPIDDVLMHFLNEIKQRKLVLVVNIY